MGVPAGMIVPPAVSVDVLGWEFSMHVENAKHVTGVYQAGRNGLRARQRKGERRRQHAKQIEQGRRTTLLSNASFWSFGRTSGRQHFRYSVPRLTNITANLEPAKPEVGRTKSRQPPQYVVT